MQMSALTLIHIQNHVTIQFNREMTLSISYLAAALIELVRSINAPLVLCSCSRNSFESFVESMSMNRWFHI